MVGPTWSGPQQPPDCYPDTTVYAVKEYARTQDLSGSSEDHGGMAQIRVLRRVASILTTPLAPEDFLGLVNPLASARQLRGVVTKVVRETPDSTTIHFRPGRG